VGQNETTSPEGVSNASRVSPYNLTNAHLYYAASLTAGVTYRFSGWYKGTAGEKVYIRTINSGGGSGGGKLITLTGDWQREDITLTAGTGTSYVYVFDARAGGMTANNFYVYGFQLEDNGVGGDATYATSYIPTFGRSATRTADVDCETANPDTSLFGQTEGTIFCEYTPVSDDTTNQSRFIRLRNSSNSNQIYMQHNALNNINAVVFNGSNQFVGQTSTGYASVGNTYKFALAYKDGDYAFYANGVQIDTGTATGLGTLAVDRLDLDNVNISKSSKVNQALVFKTRLSNEELAALTTI